MEDGQLRTLCDRESGAGIVAKSLSVSHYPNKAQLHKKQPKELTHINRRHNKHLNGEKNLSELQQVHMHTSGKPRVINRNLFSALK